MVNAFHDVLQLLYYIPECTKFQPPFGGPYHVHVQEGEPVGHSGLDVVIIIRERDVQIIFTYLCCELKVLVYCCLVHNILKSTKPIFNISNRFIPFKYQPPIIAIDSMVYGVTEVVFGCFEQVRSK